MSLPQTPCSLREAHPTVGEGKGPDGTGDGGAFLCRDGSAFLPLSRAQEFAGESWEKLSQSRSFSSRLFSRSLCPFLGHHAGNFHGWLVTSHTAKALLRCLLAVLVGYFRGAERAALGLEVANGTEQSLCLD